MHAIYFACASSPQQRPWNVIVRSSRLRGAGSTCGCSGQQSTSGHRSAVTVNSNGYSPRYPYVRPASLRFQAS
eukprot:3461805-Pleurochrysis_carterae.AAC.1